MSRKFKNPLTKRQLLDAQLTALARVAKREQRRQPEVSPRSFRPQEQTLMTQATISRNHINY